MVDSQGETTSGGTDTDSGQQQVLADWLQPAFIARSFLAKFVVSLLVVLIVVGGVSAYTYQSVSTELTDETRTEYIGVAEGSAAQIENWRRSRGDTTRRLSRFEVIQSGDTERIQLFLETEIEQLPDDVDRVHYVNLNSERILASSNPAQDGTTLNTRAAPWITDQIAYRDGVFVSDANEVHGNSTVAFVSRVNIQNGSEMALVMQTNLDAIAADLSVQADGGFTQVVDARNRIVAGTRGGSELDRNDGQLRTYHSSNSTVLKRGLAEKSGFVRNPARELDRDSVAAYAPVNGSQWVVVTHVPSSTAFSLRSTITQNLTVLMGAVLLGFAFIAVTFGRGTVRTLNRLTEKAQALESGHLDTEITVRRADEFGTLAASFASMRDSLRNRIADAEQAREEAEAARAEAVEMNEYLQEKAQSYRETMQQCAAGDLTQRMETDNSDEPMEQIAADFNEMIAELEKTIGQLQTFADDQTETTDAVLAKTDTLRTSSTRIADSAGNISEAALDQQARLRRIIDALVDVVDTVDRIADTTDLAIEDERDQLRAVQETLETAVETNDGLVPETETIASAADQQATALAEVSDRVERLKRYAQPLAEIVDSFETDDEHEFVFSTGPTEPQTDD